VCRPRRCPSVRSSGSRRLVELPKGGSRPLRGGWAFAQPTVMATTIYGSCTCTQGNQLSQDIGLSRPLGRCGSSAKRSGWCVLVLGYDGSHRWLTSLLGGRRWRSLQCRRRRGQAGRRRAAVLSTRAALVDKRCGAEVSQAWSGETADGDELGSDEMGYLQVLLCL
jgi:hypothetical protein